MIERARAGAFSAEDARTVPPASLERWFERHRRRRRAGERQAAQHGHLRPGDLLTMRVPPASYDLVMCRNVVIYFTEEVRDALHARLAAAAAPGRLPARRLDRARLRSRAARARARASLRLPEGVMDLNEYLPMFLAESREHLQELNLAVVRVEEAPDDIETVGEIFRIAHSLKGMSATMGFERIAALTHAMEDVFELLRQRRGGLEREAVDVLLRVPRRAQRGLRGDRRRRRGAARREAARGAAPHARPRAGRGALRPSSRSSRRSCRSSSRVTPSSTWSCQLARRRADARRCARTWRSPRSPTTARSSPPSRPRAPSTSSTGRTIEIWLATDHESAVVQAAAAAVPDVASATVEEPRTPERSTAAPRRPTGRQARRAAQLARRRARCASTRSGSTS